MITKIRNTKSNKNNNRFINPSLISTIVCFKCSVCGEQDQDIAENYCGNSNCPHRV